VVIPIISLCALLVSSLREQFPATITTPPEEPSKSGSNIFS
jgi:hypothetical protein